MLVTSIKMLTQESQITADVNLYFIVPSTYNSEDDCGEDMWQAFNKCLEYDLQPLWISEAKCDKLTPQKNDVFVVEEFKGDLFEKLQTFKCSIVGPRCLLLCFINGEPIPEGTSPVYTTAMRGLFISASGLTPKEKDRTEKLVGYMGGIFTKQLRGRVTHLVTASVMSAKYECAVNMKIPIVTKEWVEAIWEANLKEFVKADHSMFKKYQAPVFLNLIVTTTNLSKRQKEEIKNLIIAHGGTFMGPLDGLRVKVVVAPANSHLSEKLKYAKEACIACLTPDWVHESVKVGYALPFKDFLIKSTKACSTPEKPNAGGYETFNCSTLSVIPCELQQANCVDESLISTISNASTFEPMRNSHSIVSSVAVLDRLIFSEAKSAGPFLDGCCIYLAGFAPNHRDKLNRILNVGSATRLDDISDVLTHVIVGNETKACGELKLIKAKRLCPAILTLEWLEESIKLKRPAPEENFIFQQKSNIPHESTEPPSPLSKKNLQMLQKPRRPPIPSFNIDKKVAPLEQRNESDNLLQQYLQGSDVSASDKTVQEFFQSHTSIVEENAEKTLANNRQNQTKSFKESLTLERMEKRYSADDSAVPISQSINERLFEGLTFVVVGFSKEDNYIPEHIVTMGGQVVSSSFSGIPDYGVVPQSGAPLKHTVNEIVTDLFIDDCINNEQIVDIMYYHRPLSIKKHSNPLSSCVITMSMYTGSERTYLATLALMMGARCQDIFVRKTNLEKNTYGSTHLVCPTPEGNKYKAAVKWKLPAVTADWLKSCAAQSKLVDETPYLVGETLAPERPPCDSDTSLARSNLTEMRPPNESTARIAITPKYHRPQLQSQESGTSDTPLINKRLSLVMNTTPQSPFHVSTPETPYGQVFRPDPSPETRKGWVKWVDNFPDLRVEEPPLKRRAVSTPLSELKRQLWQKLKNRGNEEEDTGNVSVSRDDDQTPGKASEQVDNVDDCNQNETEKTPISRKLDFTDENSPAQNNEINLQIAQLDQLLQQSSNTPENRYSLSGENANTYTAEPSDLIEKCIVKDSQPVDAIVWEDPSRSRRTTIHQKRDENHSTSKDSDDDQEPEPPRRPKFMLSGIKDRTAHEQVIRNLGGDVSSDPTFDATATHLLCIRPSRNEKMLASIASGKWVLHCMFLRDSEQAGKFLDEETYEWGNPKSKNVIPEPSGDTEKLIAAAAYKWRLKLLKTPRGPFHEIVALLLVSGEKYDQFKRLIETGGGKVVQARPPYDTSPTGKKITHCFVNVRQVNQPIDWAMLASKGILCFMPQYLSDYLTSDTPLNERECVIPEFKKYLTLLPK